LKGGYIPNPFPSPPRRSHLRITKAIAGPTLALFAFLSIPAAAEYNTLYQKQGLVSSDQLGRSVAGAGDVNGDGVVDFIVGAAGANPNGVNHAGSAYVYSGADGTLLYQKDGFGRSDEFGWAVAGTGDVNGDGRDDFIIGARFADPDTLTNAGKAYVYSGMDGSLLYEKDGLGKNDEMGFSVAGAGDLNGDGKSDFIVGARLARPAGGRFGFPLFRCGRYAPLSDGRQPLCLAGIFGGRCGGCKRRRPG
jgi:hypothetical protein